MIFVLILNITKNDFEKKCIKKKEKDRLIEIVLKNQVETKNDPNHTRV